MDNMSWLTRKISNKHHDNMHSLSYVFSSRRFQCERKKEARFGIICEVFILFYLLLLKVLKFSVDLIHTFHN
jgi:hypothetical protein